jgi:hypothetical protein
MVEHYTEAEIQKLQRDFKRRSQQVGKALRDMPLNDVYILLTSYLHVTFDHLADRSVDMMLIYIVTHALESRAARREGRQMDLNSRKQLERWADIHRDPAGIHVSVNPRVTMTLEEWNLAHLLAEKASGLPYKANE